MNWQLLVVLHAVPTLYLCGLIWFVQVVHYPLFAAVGEREFVAYEQAHCRRIAPIVLPPMVVELGLALWLWFAAPPALAPWAAMGLGLLVIVWGSTFLVQVPCHERLALTADAAALRRLVVSNWARTVAWTLRGGLAVGLLLPGASTA